MQELIETLNGKPSAPRRNSVSSSSARSLILVPRVALSLSRSAPRGGTRTFSLPTLAHVARVFGVRELEGPQSDVLRGPVLARRLVVAPENAPQGRPATDGVARREVPSSGLGVICTTVIEGVGAGKWG